MAKPKALKHRCHPAHKRLEDPRFAKRVVRSRKGKGSYRRAAKTKD